MYTLYNSNRTDSILSSLMLLFHIQRNKIL